VALYGLSYADMPLRLSHSLRRISTYWSGIISVSVP